MRFFTFSENPIFDPILMPTWLHFGTKIPPRSIQKSIPRGINFLIDFNIDFVSIFARFWKPTWGHVGHIFAQNGGGAWRPSVFFVGSMLFFDFWALLAPSWLHFGGVGARFFDFLVDLGVDFGRFWGPVWRFLVTIWVLCAQSFWRSILFIKIWFWMGWWGHAKR